MDASNSRNAWAGSFASRSISARRDRKSTRLNSSHSQISYAVFCLKKKKTENNLQRKFTRRQVAKQNRVSINIAIIQCTFSVYVLKLYIRLWLRMVKRT